MNWIALGDSYTASPGTGADFDIQKGCRRNNGSYAVQLQKDFAFKEEDHLDFIACSGYTSPDTLTTTIPLIQSTDIDFMVMTLGGNDIGFAKIAVDCLVAPGIFFWKNKDCEETLTKAAIAIEDVTLENNIHAVYDAIFEKMKDDYHYQLYHVFYSRFFNDETDWCDGATFSGWFTGPKLVKVQRKRINQMADLLNARLQTIADNYIKLKAGRPSWDKGSRLITINPDKFPKPDGSGTYGLFDGHRFCEPDVRHFWDLESDKVWFFGTKEHDDTKPDATTVTAVTKRDRLNTTAEANITSLRFDLPEWAVQGFHPKTAGMKAIKEALQETLQKHRPAER